MITLEIKTTNISTIVEHFSVLLMFYCIIYLIRQKLPNLIICFCQQSQSIEDLNDRQVQNINTLSYFTLLEIKLDFTCLASLLSVNIGSTKANLYFYIVITVLHNLLLHNLFLHMAYDIIQE